MKNLIMFLLLVILSSYVIADDLTDDLTIDEDTPTVTFGTKRGGEDHVLVNGNETGLFSDGVQLKNFYKVYSGQQFSVKASCKTNAYVYILSIDSQSKLFNYFPNSAFSVSNPISSDMELPGQGESFEFDNNLGYELYYIIISKKKLNSLESLINSIPEEGLVVTSNTVNKLKRSSIITNKSLEKEIYYNKIVLIHKKNEDIEISGEDMKNAKAVLMKY